MIIRTALVVLLLAILSPAARAQSPSGIQGVWKSVEVQVVGGSNPRTVSSPQPSLYIFTRGHYSILTITSDTARTAIPQGQGRGGTVTDAQKLALYEHWSPFTANAGTYTITGNTLATKPLVAKNEGAMQGAGQTREFKLEGSTLWLIQRPPAGQTGAETRIKLTRLE